MKTHSLQLLAGLCAAFALTPMPSARSAEIIFEIVSVQTVGNGSFSLHHIDPKWQTYDPLATVGVGSKDRFGFMVSAGAFASAYNASDTVTKAWDVRIKQIRDLPGLDIEALGSGNQSDILQMRDVQRLGLTSIAVSSSVHVNAAQLLPGLASVTLIHDDGFSASCSSDCGAETGEATPPIYSYNQLRSDKDVGQELPPTGRVGSIWRLWGDVNASVSQTGFNTFGYALAQATDRLQLVSGAPEPATSLLLGASLGILGWSLRHRRNRL